MYNGRIISNEMVRQSTHFLEAGAAHFPRDWEFPFMLSCNYLNEMKTTDPAQRAAFTRLGADYVRRAAILGGGPDWLPVLAATIYTRDGEQELAIRHLEEVYASSEDPKVRERVKAKLEQLRAAGEAGRAERIAHAREDLEAGSRNWAPYVPIDLFVLTGRAPADRDLRALVGADGLVPLDDAGPASP
jgi:hypothetical protein